MPVSGLVVRVRDDQALDRFLDWVEGEPRVSRGAVRGRCIAVSLDTQGADEDRALRGELETQEGVLAVDVVFIHFDEALDESDDSGNVQTDRNGARYGSTSDRQIGGGGHPPGRTMRCAH